MLKNEQSNTVSVEYSPDQIYTKKQLMEMGFPFTLNGDIVTLNELEEHYQRGIEYRKQKLIDKACEYIRTHVWETVDADEDPIIESVCNTTKEGFIKDFKRYMDNNNIMQE